MKTSRRVIITILLLAVVISVVSVTAYATSNGNTGNTQFNNFTLETQRRYLNPREKWNYSPCYVYVFDADALTPIYVAAHASTSLAREGIIGNYTWDANGTSTVWVTILPQNHYLVRSNIWENGYRHATLGFSVNSSYPNEITGVWSPDSSEAAQQAYPYAYYYR